MEKAVQGENSSSQRDNIIVSNIIERGTVENSYIICFSNGSSFVISGDFLISKKILPGKEISADLYSEIALRDEEARAFSKTMNMIAIRDHSSFEIKMKLSKKRFSKHAIEQALSKAKQKGFVNDENFAVKYAASRIRKNEGPNRLLSSLLKKGISMATAEKTIKHICDEKSVKAHFENAASKYLRNRSIDQNKFFRSMTQKGYPLYLIKNFIYENNLFINKK